MDNLPFQDQCNNNGWSARFTCPGCYEDLDHDEWVGKSGDCPKCHRHIECEIEHEPVSICRLVTD